MATAVVKRLGQAIRCTVKPAADGLVPGLVADLTRSRTELLTENALLRQQLIVLRRAEVIAVPILGGLHHEYRWAA